MKKLHGPALIALAALPLMYGCTGDIPSDESSVTPEGTIEQNESARAPSAANGEGDGGLQIAFQSLRDGNQEIYIVNADGSGLTNLTKNPASDRDPAFSPDGSRIAFTSNRDGDRAEIYVMDADGTGSVRLTTEGGQRPAFSPDGAKIAFLSYRDGNGEIYIMNSDGTEQTRLMDSAAFDGSPVFSPDGSQIAFETARDGDYEIYIMNVDGSALRRLTNNTASDRSPAFSPDGGQIAFSSDRDSQWKHIYLMDVDGTRATRLTNEDAFDSLPVFGPDGKMMAFSSDRDSDMLVNNDIFLIDLVSRVVTRLTSHPGYDYAPSLPSAVGTPKSTP